MSEENMPAGTKRANDRTPMPGSERITVIPIVPGLWTWAIDGDLSTREHPTRRTAFKAAKCALKKKIRKALLTTPASPKGKT